MKISSPSPKRYPKRRTFPLLLVKLMRRRAPFKPSAYVAPYTPRSKYACFPHLVCLHRKICMASGMSSSLALSSLGFSRLLPAALSILRSRGKISCWGGRKEVQISAITPCGGQSFFKRLQIILFWVTIRLKKTDSIRIFYLSSHFSLFSQ